MLVHSLKTNMNPNLREQKVRMVYKSLVHLFISVGMKFDLFL